ncbi:hypothetical protein Slin15195_G130660 [Septoria linicola]|uniref:Uncharacterized protein n=1 Tax=Septoria linicola TaxID=215465 RepID=A0A9Q9ERB8_9PEZI|nr:hypothetical protein Slin15195_G130660 [Septoria linicola]
MHPGHVLAIVVSFIAGRHVLQSIAASSCSSIAAAAAAAKYDGRAAASLGQSPILDYLSSRFTDNAFTAGPKQFLDESRGPLRSLVTASDYDVLTAQTDCLSREVSNNAFVPYDVASLHSDTSYNGTLARTRWSAKKIRVLAQMRNATSTTSQGQMNTTALGVSHHVFDTPLDFFLRFFRGNSLLATERARRREQKAQLHAALNFGFQLVGISPEEDREADPSCVNAVNSPFAAAAVVDHAIDAAVQLLISMAQEYGPPRYPLNVTTLHRSQTALLISRFWSAHITGLRGYLSARHSFLLRAALRGRMLVDKLDDFILLGEALPEDDWDSGLHALGAEIETWLTEIEEQAAGFAELDKSYYQSEVYQEEWRRYHSSISFPAATTSPSFSFGSALEARWFWLRSVAQHYYHFWLTADGSSRCSTEFLCPVYFYWRNWYPAEQFWWRKSDVPRNL